VEVKFDRGTPSWHPRRCTQETRILHAVRVPKAGRRYQANLMVAN
jgi:hypothetical protein